MECGGEAAQKLENQNKNNDDTKSQGVKEHFSKKSIIFLTWQENGRRFPRCPGCKTQLSSPAGRAISEEENSVGANLARKT